MTDAAHHDPAEAIAANWPDALERPATAGDPTTDPSAAEAIIDALGGTSAVAAMFRPPIRPASVSGWRRSGIPAARLHTLALLHPGKVRAPADRAA